MEKSEFLRFLHLLENKKKANKQILWLAYFPYSQGYTG